MARFGQETVKFRVGAQALMLIANVSSVRAMPGLLHRAVIPFCFQPSTFADTPALDRADTRPRQFGVPIST
jgi:hypothetical protein